jgi:hypothetical protein
MGGDVRENLREIERKSGITWGERWGAVSMEEWQYCWNPWGPLKDTTRIA